MRFTDLWKIRPLCSSHISTFTENGIVISIFSCSSDIEEGLQFFAGSGEANPGFRKARALAELKFTYVVTCQIYGQQKQKKDVRAADISYLMRT
jgi:hypothetical protein